MNNKKMKKVTIVVWILCLVLLGIIFLKKYVLDVIPQAEKPTQITENINLEKTGDKTGDKTSLLKYNNKQSVIKELNTTQETTAIVEKNKYSDGGKICETGIECESGLCQVNDSKDKKGVCRIQSGLRGCGKYLNTQGKMISICL